MKKICFIISLMLIISLWNSCSVMGKINSAVNGTEESLSKEVTVYVNKENIGTTPVIIENGRYYVPVTVIEDGFSFAVSVDPLTKVAVIEDTVFTGDMQYSLGHSWWALQVGNPLFLKNIPNHPIDRLSVDDTDSFATPLAGSDGNIYIPISFIGYIVGGQVDYLDDGRIKFSLNDKIMDEIRERKIKTTVKGRQFSATLQMMNLLPYFVSANTPVSSENPFDKARKLCVEEKYSEAIQYYDKALEIDPRDYNALVYKGYALELLGKHREAQDCFNKAFSISPIEAYFLYRKLGDSYEKGKELSGLGKHEEASKFFDTIFLMSPLEAYSNYRKAMGFYNDAMNSFNIGNYKDALNSLNKALEIDPENSLLQEIINKCNDLLNI